jgi:hypothetical protein
MILSVNNNFFIPAFWDIAPCSFVEVDRRFRGAYCSRHQDDDEALLMETVSAFEISVYFYKTTEGCHLHTVMKVYNTTKNATLLIDSEMSRGAEFYCNEFVRLS